VITSIEQFDSFEHHRLFEVFSAFFYCNHRRIIYIRWFVNKSFFLAQKIFFYIKEHAKLSKNLYSERYFVVAHILNKSLTQILNWNSSLIYMQKLLKKLIQNEIIHFKMFNCKTFSLFKKINALKKNEKMKSWTYIENLIKYDFINIFRV
jgi:hypothetical protein